MTLRRKLEITTDYVKLCASILDGMTETQLPLYPCSYIEGVFGLLGKRWMGQLIDLLLQRPARFNELHAALPALSSRVLSERLTELQDLGLVEREVDPGPPITATYRLTERAQQLGPAMDALRVWGGAPVDDEGRPLPPAR
jgi:DNA-binding HxlR family transcriptional regulator